MSLFTKDLKKVEVTRESRVCYGVILCYLGTARYCRYYIDLDKDRLDAVQELCDKNIYDLKVSETYIRTFPKEEKDNE